MIIDARMVPANETVETEVCIIGAGPAGITLAREFIGRDFRVCLLESGGDKPDKDTQSLCAGEMDGALFQDLKESRYRQFGGTANKWHIQITPNQIGGRCGPFEAIDFEKRDEVPYSGWPFDKTHLDPYYERAQSICKLGPYVYDAKDWQGSNHLPMPLNGDRVKTSIYQFTPRAVFAEDYRDEINQADNITTYLYANVVDIETNDALSQITRVQVACLDGKRFSVTAKLFILAAGGIENARLMLLSNRSRQAAGLGNQNDLVGRFFMDHPGVTYMFIPQDRNIFNSMSVYDMRQVNGISVKGKVILDEAVKRREKLLNSGALIHPRPKGFRSEAISSLKVLMTSLRRGKLPKDTFRHLGTAIAGTDDIVRSAYNHLLKIKPIVPNDLEGGWFHLPNKEKMFASFQVSQMFEQSPDPANRVMLSNECDRLGLPKLKLRWGLNELDYFSIRRTKEIFQEEFLRLGLGRILVDWEDGVPFISATTAHHHMGTTRMHTDPKQGVVDENSRVHGISNLFVAGSSVFPTGGYINPTLTIIAMTVRLADHVKQVMVSSAAEVG
jgi:choline dehydrogenase-like flavoprotein